MDYFGYAYFVERPRRVEELTLPHLIEKERPYRIVTEVQLPAIDYENFIGVFIPQTLKEKPIPPS